MNRSVKMQQIDGLAVVKLNRPEAANALNGAMLNSLLDIFCKLKDDSGVKGVIVTGSDNYFCAGGDILEMSQMAPMEAVMFAEAGQKLMFAIERVGKPVIAAVNGYSIGGGLELALAADFIVAAKSAIFSAPEIKLGVIPGFGGTQRLARLVGKAKAKELIYTGDRIDAAEAHSIGLVNRLYPDDKLIRESMQLMSTICRRGPLSLRMGKEIIDAGYDIDLANACLMERDAFALCFSTAEQKEGMSAFLEKRPPNFPGR